METEEKITEDKRFIIGVVVVSIITLAISIFTSIYANNQKNNSNSTAQIAEMICEMTVESSENSELIINPYCKVTVRDFKGDSITQTDVDYTIEIIPKDNIVLPEHYWKDVNDNIIARSVDIKDANGNVIERKVEFPTQNFKNNLKEETGYTVVFLNPGDKDITRYVDFKLVAEQAK